MSLIIEKNQKLRAEVIRQFYYRKNLSLAEISKLTNKSLPSVTAVVMNLIADGYLIEQGLAPSTGGRRPSAFFFNPHYKKYVVAVAMDQFISRLCIYDLSGNLVLPLQLLEFDIQDGKPETLISFIQDCINESLVAPSSLLGVGIGMPGFVNADKGENNSYLKPADGSTLQQYLGAALGLPVFIDNDSSLIALAELNFGEARGRNDTLVVNIGWGTGLGMIIDGRLYRGSSGYAGEFSHIPLSDSNNLCSCGKRGCLEVDTSLLVMARKAQEAVNGGAESSMKELFKDSSKHPGDHFLTAVNAHDPLALSILSKAAFQLGKGLATLIHILNPECIVLSGRGAKAGRMLLPAIQQAINEFCIPRIAEQTSIKLSVLNDEAELLAAASLVVENVQFD